MGKTIHVSGFPFRIPAETIVAFFEQLTGRGTVEALEVKNVKLGSKAYVRVQFTSVNNAELIMTWGRVGLRYGTTYLKAWEQNIDLVRPRSYEHEMEDVTLNFGCQISKERFSVLWKAANVTVKFGPRLKNMHFFLRHDSVEYRLQLYCENVWQIVLYNPRGHTEKLILFQVRLNFNLICHLFICFCVYIKGNKYFHTCLCGVCLRKFLSMTWKDIKFMLNSHLASSEPVHYYLLCYMHKGVEVFKLCCFNCKKYAETLQCE